MSRFIFVSAVAAGLAMSVAAIAQTTPDANPACSRTAKLASQNPTSQTSMAGTSSGAGMAGSGASSASIGTGPTDKTGMMSPCIPGTAGKSATGAMPSTEKTP